MLLYKYCTKGFGGDKDFRQLLELVDAHQPALAPLLCELQCVPETANSPPEALSSFLKQLACSTPVSALVSQSEELHEALHSPTLSCQDPHTMKLFLREAPVIARLLSSLQDMPEACRVLLQAISHTARAPFAGNVHQLGETDQEEESSYFPTFSKKCERGTYIMDAKGSKDKDCETKKCHKKTRGHYSLSPGLFILLCSHGVCYGYSIMKTAESPNIAFTVLRTRFKKAPERVIYDNACHLLSYCLNRDPAFFKDTQFLVDRFHWRNHTGCSVGHNASDYGHMQNVNTQAAEQCNAHLKKLRPLLAYMKQDNFMSHVTFTLWFYNLGKQFQASPSTPSLQRFHRLLTSLRRC